MPIINRPEHIGSLLRPDVVKSARAEYNAGKLDARGLRKAEDQAIAQLVKKQEEVGLRSVTDGASLFLLSPSAEVEGES